MSNRVCGAAILCLAALTARVLPAQRTATPAAAPRAGAIAVQAGVRVAADSVRIGDPFRVTVGVRAPRGATIAFPRQLDTAGTVQSLDQVVVRPTADSTAVEQFADYRVAAWDIGTQPIHIPDIVVTLGTATRTVTLSDSIRVRSLLPADSAKRVPKPPRALFESGGIPWWVWALIAAAVILGLWLWWWTRRRRGGPAIALAVDPYERAEAEFARIDALGLLEAGERARYVTLTVEVLRDYLAARYAQASLALTASELARTTRDLPHVPNEPLVRLLTESDLIKFARRAVSTDRARELGRDARAIVAEEHAAWRAAQAQAASQATPPAAREAA